MPTIKFTSNLKRFYPDLQPITVSGENIASLIKDVNQHYPGIRDYIVDDQGHLRQHVNIFIGNEMVRDKEGLSDTVSEDDDIYIMQALSGG